MLVNTEAFVLKSRKYNEADSLLVLFSRKLGKISAVAKGSRRAKSQMLAGIQPFCYSDFQLYKGRSLYTVNQVDSRKIFYPLREDYRKLTYAAYLVELVEIEITEGQTHPRLFSLFGKSLTLLSREDVEMETLIRSFELHFMGACGYKPQLQGCTACQETKSGKWWFSLEQGGILCRACRGQGQTVRPISHTCLKLMRYLTAKSIDETAHIKIHPRLNDELQQLTKDYLLYHMERFQFRSLKLLSHIDVTPMLPHSAGEKTDTSEKADEASGVIARDRKELEILPIKEYERNIDQKSGLTETVESDTFNETEYSENSDEKE